jgi:hypothetical protein
MGDVIRAGFESGGVCRNGEGMIYAESEREFAGNLTGNTIQGKLVICVRENRTTEPVELNLPVIKYIITI